MASFGGSNLDDVLASAEENFRNVEDPHQKLAVVMAAAIDFNAVLASQQRGTSLITSSMIMGGLTDKLRKAIDKFTEMLTEICHLTEAISFSIGVSVTGLSIAVNFSSPQSHSASYALGGNPVH